MRSKNQNFIEKLPKLIVLAMLFTLLSATGVHAQEGPPGVVNPFDTGDDTGDDAPPALELEEEDDSVAVDETDETEDVVAMETTTDDTVVVEEEELPETGPSAVYLLGLAGLAAGRRLFKKKK
ncbi:hypothetical protein GF354_06570 [Candidatus Peregrinibacteria bacterium]|nr:hypothetical protein [Candidatus Peregrinibacteria bacterium]